MYSKETDSRLIYNNGILSQFISICKLVLVKLRQSVGQTLPTVYRNLNSELLLTMRNGNMSKVSILFFSIYLICLVFVHDYAKLVLGIFSFCFLRA